MTFDDDEIALIGSVIGEAISEQGNTCYACAIMPDHVHLLIRRHRDKAEDMPEQVWAFVQPYDGWMPGYRGEGRSFNRVAESAKRKRGKLSGLRLLPISQSWVLLIPLNGFREARLPGFAGAPAEFLFDFRGIDGVAPIVAKAIGNVADQRQRLA